MAATVVITQRNSSAGTNLPQRETLRTLGLHGIGSSSERSDGPALQGMLRRVAHLVTVEQSSKSAAKGSDG